MAAGVIYILTNPSFPQFVKIGYAKDVQKRLQQLNRSETLPYAFRAYATYDVDHRLTDKVLHELIDQLNPDLRTIETVEGRKRTKEFFEMTPEEAYSILDAIARISGTENRLHRVTPTGEQLEEEYNAEESRRVAGRGKQARFRFSMVGIEEGEEVQYINDSSIVVTVVGDSHVKYKGMTTSLLAVAQELLGKANAVQGPLYFTYQGERLTDRRARMESVSDVKRGNEEEFAGDDAARS